MANSLKNLKTLPKLFTHFKSSPKLGVIGRHLQADVLPAATMLMLAKKQQRKNKKIRRM